MLKQKKIVAVLAPFFSSAGIFEKFQTVRARPARQDEVVETFTSDGKETDNEARLGDFVVQNNTSAQEHYVVKHATFVKRYVKMDASDNEDEWSTYKPIGKCRGIIVDHAILKKLRKKSGFKFEAPWGSDMICNEGDMLVTTDLEGTVNAIYRIGKQEFSETYRPLSNPTN